ncbi:hypothetical protein LZ554_002799 [Drepanopeziza brunnea f. sp. 'monogermtubi']|nr:hypothetical protein LZ554_002799 [Drepanopeziza brunnea f. sp. 'monogermtubi']
MARINLLDATCVRTLTAGYSHLTGNGIDDALTTTCAHHASGPSPWQQAYKILIAILLTVIVTLSLVAGCCSRAKLVRKLRQMPSHRIHRELEDTYEDYWVRTRSRKEREAWRRAGRRYLSVKYVDDAVAMRRTVTVVEDLRLAPGPRAGDERVKDEERGSTYELEDRTGRAGAGTGVGAGAVQPPPNPAASQAPLLTVPPPAATRNENDMVARDSTFTEEEFEASPPPYQHDQHGQYPWMA